MTRIVALLALLSLTAACAGPPDRTVWLRPGEPSVDAERALLACRRDAGAQFPERREVRVRPNVGIGVGIGSGGVRTGVGTTIQLDRPDRNEDLRGSAFRACMARAGYRAAILPECTGPSQELVQQPFDPRGLCATEAGRVAAPL